MINVSGRVAADDIGDTMSQEQLEALIARLASDPAFASALAAATTPEDAQQVAAEHGFDVTPGELVAATSGGELSDMDLEAVAGGFSVAPRC